MTTLRVRLDIWGAGDGQRLPVFGTVANIYDLSKRGGERRTTDLHGNSLRDLVIPAGPLWEEDRFLELDLEPGRYLVEAAPPSGSVVTKEVVVIVKAVPHELLLFGGPSPREWLGWQQFQGNIPDSRAYNQDHDGWAPEPGIETRVDLISLPSLTPPERETADLSSPQALAARGLFLEMPDTLSPDHSLPVSTLFPSTPHAPLATDQLSEMHRFGPGSSTSIDLPGGGYRSDAFVRHYLFLRGEEMEPQYCVLPVPWLQAPHFDEGADVEVLARRRPLDRMRRRYADTGHGLSVTVNDSILGSIIGYLGSGDLPSAGKVMANAANLAEDMLYHKIGNPLAAAAGAYVLLGNAETAQDARWHDWVGNLARWYSWLPDGAIQHAWVKLRRQVGPDDLKRAREDLLEGYRRGLPFYTRGVRLLIDGLTLFANDARAAELHDEEVETALRDVRRWARQVNVRQAFTCVAVR